MHKKPAQAVAPEPGMDGDSQTWNLVTFVPPSKHAIGKNFLSINEYIVEILTSSAKNPLYSLVRKRMGLEVLYILRLFEGPKKGQ
jgi:hypothetical protein